MIHVKDQDFAELVRAPFEESFLTHTVTSPSQQLLASLDVARRQAELEGYELVTPAAGPRDPAEAGAASGSPHLAPVQFPDARADDSR